MTDKAHYLIIFILLLILSACEHRIASDDDMILAEVDGRILTLNDLKKDVSPDLYVEDSLKIIEHQRNNWITRQLKVKEAQRLGLDRNPDVQRRIQKAKEAILADAYNEAVALGNSSNPVSRSEAHAYYESNKDKFVLAERHIRFRHMISQTRSDAQNARNAILRGQNWREIAGQYSINAELAYRNSQRYWPVSSAAWEFEALNNLLQIIGINEISSIQRIGDHYHFVQLIESREAGEHPQIEWIIDQITEWLMLDRKRKHVRSMEQNLFLQAQANNELRIFDVRVPEQEIEIITDSL